MYYCCGFKDHSRPPSGNLPYIYGCYVTIWVTPKQMSEEQQKDATLELVYQLVTAGEKPKTSAIAKIKSKAVQKHLLQFNRLTLKRVFYINFISTTM